MGLSRDQRDMRYRILQVVDRRGTATHEVVCQNLRLDPKKILATMQQMASESAPALVQVGRHGAWRLTSDGRQELTAARVDPELARSGAADPTEGTLALAERVLMLRRQRDEAAEAFAGDLVIREHAVEEAMLLLEEAQQALDALRARRDAALADFEEGLAQAMADLRTLTGG